MEMSPLLRTSSILTENGTQARLLSSTSTGYTAVSGRTQVPSLGCRRGQEAALEMQEIPPNRKRVLERCQQLQSGDKYSLRVGTKYGQY
jgi:hypothetical protein